MTDETSREQQLIGQAKSAKKRFLEAAGDSTQALIELGNSLIELMEDNKTLKNGSWKKYREEKLPWLNKKMDQRARKVATKIDLGKHPALSFLSQRKLLQLAASSGDKSISETLEANGIDCDFSIEDSGKILEFEEKIDRLIKTLRKEAKDQRGPIEPFKRISKSVANLERRVDEISSADIRDQLEEIDLGKIEAQVAVILQKIKSIKQVSD